MVACDNFGNYNTQACGWHFGDCCKATCENCMWYKPYSCGALGYILVSEAPAPRQQLQLVRNQRSSYSWGFGSLSGNTYPIPCLGNQSIELDNPEEGKHYTNYDVWLPQTGTIFQQARQSGQHLQCHFECWRRISIYTPVG